MVSRSASLTSGICAGLPPPIISTGGAPGRVAKAMSSIRRLMPLSAVNLRPKSVHFSSSGAVESTRAAARGCRAVALLRRRPHAMHRRRTAARRGERDSIRARLALSRFSLNCHRSRARFGATGGAGSIYQAAVRQCCLLKRVEPLHGAPTPFAAKKPAAKLDRRWTLPLACRLLSQNMSQKVIMHLLKAPLGVSPPRVRTQQCPRQPSTARSPTWRPGARPSRRRRCGCRASWRRWRSA